jgi:hypothetical protein
MTAAEATPTPGTRRRSDGGAVPFGDAKAAWVVAARDVLIETAKQYGAYVTYGELAARLFDITDIETSQQLQYWIGPVLGRVADECHQLGEPPLTALCVRQTEAVGPGYTYVIELTGETMPADVDQHAAEARLRCYQFFGAELPADGGRPSLTRKIAADRQRKARREPRAVSLCSSCFTQLPNSGQCDSCR